MAVQNPFFGKRDNDTFSTRTSIGVVFITTFRTDRYPNPFQLQRGLTVQFHRIYRWKVITVRIIRQHHGIQSFIKHIIAF